jgi:hypothetical protein
VSYANTGQSWDRAGLRAYLATVARPKWALGVTCHHTSTPNLAMRPRGWNAQLMKNVAFGYTHERGWDRGPHFFPDDSRVWGLTPPSVQGIHAVSFNRTHLGIEVLGDYDGRDNATTGRGRACWQTAFWTIAELLRWLGLPPGKNTINFHRDDPKTSKTCPGTSISHAWVLAGVRAAMDLAQTPPPPPSTPVGTDERVAIAAWLRANGKALPIILDPQGHVLVGGKWIETSHYDRATQTTTALRSELEADLGR